MNENIVCSQCGTVNVANTNFCVNCGNKIPTNVESGNIEQVGVDNNVNAGTFPQMNNVVQPMNNNIQQVNHNIYPNNSGQVSSNINGKFNLFKYIAMVVIKPFDSFKKDEENISKFKNACILTVVLVGLLTIIGLFQTMLDAVRVTSFWTDEVEWVWENLKEIEYIKVIGQSLLMYAGLLFGISGVYFLSGLVIKKDVKFPKLLGVTVTAFIPFVLATYIVSPLLSLIYSPLGLVVNIVGFVYTLLIFIELINEIVKIENKNSRIYFHLTCLSILIIVGGFIAYKLILGSLSSGLFDLFG